MMAHEFNPTPQQALAQETVALVRDELSRYIAGAAESDGLSFALSRAAREAREKRILAEQLLVTLKDVWFALPQVQGSDPTMRGYMLQRVITMCIQEYYRS